MKALDGQVGSAMEESKVSQSFMSVVSNAVDERKFTEAKDTVEIPVGQSTSLISESASTKPETK